MPHTMTKKLTPKQAAFVREYLIDRNGTQAAIRAGYSEKTAQEQASQNLSKLIIADAITKGEEEHAARCNVTVDSLTEELIADRKLARDIEQPSPAITATMSIAKLHGLDVNKIDLSSKDGTMTPKNFNEFYSTDKAGS